MIRPVILALLLSATTAQAQDPASPEKAAAAFQNLTGMTPADLLAALQAGTGDLQAVDAVAAGAEVIIVTTAALQAAAGDAVVLDDVLGDGAVPTIDMITALNANPGAVTAIEEQGLLAENVLALHGLDDGRVVVVIDDTL